MNLLKSLALILIIGSASIFGHSASAAAETKCLTANEMTEISKRFRQFSNLANKEYCFDGSQTSNLLATIAFMQKTEFNQIMNNSRDDLFSGRFAGNWWDYFTGRIDEFDVQSSCPKGVGAYVYGWGGNTMYVCPMMLTDLFSSLDRASVFMHEARHIDGYPHVTCRNGPRRGINGACDNRISDGGSYAVTVETYAQLAKYGQIHPALKAYARSAAVIYADEAFDTPTRINRSSNLILLGNNKQFYNLQLQTSPVLTSLGQASDLGKITLRAQHLILIPDNKNVPAGYIFVNNEGAIKQSPSDAITEYNSKSPSERATWVDIHNATQWNAKIYEDSIRFSCSASRENNSDIKLNSKAVATLYPNGYQRISRSAQLLLANGQIVEFGCNESEQSFVRPANLRLSQNYKRIHKIDNTVVGLTFDGHLFNIDMNSGTATPIITAVDGAIYEIAPRQSFEFFDQN